MEITIPKGKERSEELREFKEKMIRAIKEAESSLEVNQNNKKKDKTNDKVEREKAGAIKEIENLITERGLKFEDLDEECFNYKEQINNLDKVWKIREARDKIFEIIYRQEVKSDNNKNFSPSEKGGNQPTNKDKSPQQKSESQFPSKSGDNSQKDKKENYNNLTREDLIKKKLIKEI